MTAKGYDIKNPKWLETKKSLKKELKASGKMERLKAKQEFTSKKTIQRKLSCNNGSIKNIKTVQRIFHTL